MSDPYKKEVFIIQVTAKMDDHQRLTEREVITLAYLVRGYQKEYFKDRDKEILVKSKQTEALLDQALLDYFRHNKKDD